MLYHDFLTNNQRVIHKWLHYFPIYEEHLSKFKNKSVIFWEIGVFKGGSVQMWKRYLGPFAAIIGIDIDPACKRVEEDQIHVRIGNQSDCNFLQGVIDEFGQPDIVVDDGSHKNQDITDTFNFLYGKTGENGVYLIEDLHAVYMAADENNFNRMNSALPKAPFMELCKNLANSLTSGEESLEFVNTTYFMSFYDSIVVFQKAAKTLDALKAARTGG
jgi:hypothetical protein